MDIREVVLGLLLVSGLYMGTLLGDLCWEMLGGRFVREIPWCFVREIDLCGRKISFTDGILLYLDSGTVSLVRACQC